MAEQYQNWKQTHFYGGFSDDRFMGIPNSFRYGKAIEIRKNPNSISLAYAVEAQTITLTAAIKAMVTVQGTGDRLVFCNDGKIFRQAAGSATWTLCYTDTGGAAILNAIEYNNYVYWATAGNIHRVAVANIDNAWTTDVAEDYKAFANDNANAHPAIELNNKLYWGDGYYLAELDSLGTWTDNKLEIFHDEEIRALTFGGSVMRIWTRKTSKIDFGQKYHWNGTTEAWSERSSYRQMVHTAINKGGYDYVLAGQRPILYRVDGYEWFPLTRLPLVYDTESCIIAPNAIDIYDNLLVFGPAENGGGSIGKGVWTYGQEDTKYPDSLMFEYPTVNDNSTDKVFMVHTSNGELFFSWQNAGGTSWGLNKVNTTKYATSGSIHSRVMYGDHAASEKAAMSLSMAFVKLAAGEKIEVFLRKDLASSWEATAELSADYAYDPASDASYPDRNICFKRKDAEINISDFVFLESKLQLTAGTSQASTPELVEFSVDFDPFVELTD